MPISLNNSKDIVANSVSIIKGNRTIDLVETIDDVQGFAPSTLNSLEKLATAMNNDPAFFTALSTSIENKADKSTTYTKTSMDTFLNAKVDDTEMADYALKTYVTTAVNALVNSAPGLLDTLGEIAAYLGNPTNTSTNLIALISTKANSSDTFLNQK